MPLQNRVTPEGEIVATPARGNLMGNRGGAFHRPDRTLGERRWASRQWICCRLSFKGRRRVVMTPNRYTELFFLDEATALAAGHRPCFECRREDAKAFAEAWRRARGLAQPPTAAQMDRVLHGERVAADGSKRTFAAPLAALPAGTMVRWLGASAAIGASADGRRGVRLKPWTAGGYGPEHIAAGTRTKVDVLTPETIVDILRAGYQPSLHPLLADTVLPG